MVMTSDETRIQILANWPMSHAKRVTRDNRKNPEDHVVCRDKKTADRHKLSRRKIMANSGFFLLPVVTRFACDIGQLARIWKEKKIVYNIVR